MVLVHLRWAACVLLVVAPSLSSGYPALPAKNPAAIPLGDNWAVGKWKVEFANGVVETCEIRKDGTAKVVEPMRTSEGKVRSELGVLVIIFDDERLERWTPVGKRMVVEHWFPARDYPTGTPVRGIADRAK